MSLQIRRGPTVDRLTITPVDGELIYDTTEQKLYIGDGTTPGGNPASGFTVSDAQIAAAALITDGNYTNLSFSYDPETNELSGEVDLTTYLGTIQATGFSGSVVSGTSVVLVNSTNSSINLDGTIKGNVIPSVNVSYDLGSPSFRFRDLYLSGTSLYLGDAVLTATGTSVNLPSGSTVGGIPIGSGGGGTGVVEGSNYRINIIGLDSSIIVDSNTNTITANQINGNVTGSLTGDVNGNVTGDLTGFVNGNVTGDVTGNLFGGVIGSDGSTFIVNPFTNSINASNILGNLTGNVTGDLLGNVTGNVLGSVTGNVFGSVTGNVTGSLTGPVFGDLKGSVFGDDSSVIINGIDNTFHGKLGADLDVNGFRLIGNQVSISPTGRTIIGSASLLRNGMLGIIRPFFYGDSGIYAGARTDGRSGFLYASHHNNVGVDRMVFYRTRRDEINNTYTPVLSGDQVGEVNFTAMSALVGDLPSPLVESNTTASIRVIVDGSPSGANAPGRIEFRTNDGTNNILRARLNKTGVFAVNTLSGLTSTLTVSGNFIVSGNLVTTDGSTVILNGTTGDIPGYVSIATLKSIASTSATYAAFQAAIAAL